MNCKKCGNQIEDGFNNCPNCGERVNVKTKQKKLIFKKWWFWLIIAVVLIGIIGGAGGSADEEPTTIEHETIAGISDATDTPVVDTTENAVADTTATQTSSNIYKVGEIFNDNGLKIAFVSAEKWTDYNEFSAPASGNMIVRYYFEVTNESETDKYISSYDFQAYVDGIAVEHWYYGDDDLSLTLSAGRKGNGCVYFELPADATSVETEYEYNVWTDDKVIFIAEF